MNRDNSNQPGIQYAQPVNNSTLQPQPAPMNGTGGGGAQKNRRVIIAAIIVAALIVAAGIITAVLLLQKEEEPEPRAKVFVFTEYEQTIDKMEEAFRGKDGKIPRDKEIQALKKDYDYVVKDNAANRLFQSVKMEYNPSRLLCVLNGGHTYCHMINDASYMKDDKGIVTEKESVIEETEPTEIDYSVMEDVINRYAYGYVGGSMQFAYHQQNIYFANSEYNTSEVMCYDMRSNDIRTVAKDGNNALSAPCVVSNTGVIVKSLPQDQDPLEADWSLANYHVYDYDSQELLVLDAQFDFRFLLSYEGGKVYGADENSIFIANADGSDSKRLPFYADNPADWRIYNYKGAMYVYYCEETNQQFNYHLAKLNDNSVDVLFDCASNAFFADNLCYYAKAAEQGYEFFCYDLVKQKAQKVGSVENIPWIYCVLGDRIYYRYRVNDSGVISINYYDMKAHTDKQISSDFPQLGGW